MRLHTILPASSNYDARRYHERSHALCTFLTQPPYHYGKLCMPTVWPAKGADDHLELSKPGDSVPVAAITARERRRMRRRRVYR